jgi:ATP synthase F1 delta subunit
MAELTIDTTYGHALYLAAKEVDKVKLILEETREVRSLLEKEGDFVAFITTPVIPAKEKKMVLEKVFDGVISRELLNLLFVLVDKGRTRHMEKIFKAYEGEIYKAEGYGEGKIFSVVPIVGEQLSRFEEETSRLLRQKVKLENVIDPSLVGGMKILIQGKIIDASLRKRLEDLSNTII